MNDTHDYGMYAIVAAGALVVGAPLDSLVRLALVATRPLMMRGMRGQGACTAVRTTSVARTGTRTRRTGTTTTPDLDGADAVIRAGIAYGTTRCKARRLRRHAWAGTS